MKYWISFLFLLIPLTALSQSSLWTDADSITSGQCDDTDPVFLHTGVWFSVGQPVLMFVRRSDTASIIAVKKYSIGTLQWESAVEVISQTDTSQPQRSPDYAQLSFARYEGGYVGHTFALAAWERRVNGFWNIYFRQRMDSIWSSITMLTNESADNRHVKINHLSDSTFVVTWKHGNELRYSLATPAAVTLPQTMLSSASDSLEYDMAGSTLVWTSRDSTKNIIIRQTYSSLNPLKLISTPDTISFAQSVYHPMIDPYYYLFFETIMNRKRQIYEYFSSSSMENISQDTIYNSCNASIFEIPQITSKVGVRKITAASLFQNTILAVEKYNEKDTILVFIHAGSSDTIRSAGFNRNPHIGLTSFYDNSYYAVPIVWESSRNGHVHLYSCLALYIIDGVTQRHEFARQISLSQNYPNPFNPVTTIQYTIAQPDRVTLKVFDLLGREVAALVDEKQSAGSHSVVFDGAGLASGIYFYRMSSGAHSVTKKFILLR